MRFFYLNIYNYIRVNVIEMKRKKLILMLVLFFYCLFLYINVNNFDVLRDGYL